MGENSNIHKIEDAIKQVQTWKNEGKTDLAERGAKEILEVAPNNPRVITILEDIRNSKDQATKPETKDAEPIEEFKPEPVQTPEPKVEKPKSDETKQEAEKTPEIKPQVEFPSPEVPKTESKTEEKSTSEEEPKPKKKRRRRRRRKKKTETPTTEEPQTQQAPEVKPKENKETELKTPEPKEIPEPIQKTKPEPEIKIPDSIPTPEPKVEEPKPEETKKETEKVPGIVPETKKTNNQPKEKKEEASIPEPFKLPNMEPTKEVPKPKDTKTETISENPFNVEKTPEIKAEEPKKEIKPEPETPKKDSKNESFLNDLKVPEFEPITAEVKESSENDSSTPETLEEKPTNSDAIKPDEIISSGGFGSTLGTQPAEEEKRELDIPKIIITLVVLIGIIVGIYFGASALISMFNSGSDQANPPIEDQNNANNQQDQLTDSIKNRNRIRSTDLRSIEIALEEYFDKNKEFPDAKDISEDLVEGRFLTQIPIDPENENQNENGDTYQYIYSVFKDPETKEKNQIYVLYALLEKVEEDQDLDLIISNNPNFAESQEFKDTSKSNTSIIEPYTESDSTNKVQRVPRK